MYPQDTCSERNQMQMPAECTPIVGSTAEWCYICPLMKLRKGYAIALIGLVMLLSAGAFLLIPKLQFDYDFAKFFPDEDEDVAFYRNFMPSTDNKHYLMVALPNEAGIFEAAYLDSLRATHLRLESETVKVHVITDLFNPVVGPMGEAYKVPFFPESDSAKVDTAHILNHPLFRNIWVSADAKTSVMQVVIDTFVDNNQREAFVQDLQTKLYDMGFEEVHLAGPVRGQTYFIATMRREIVLMAAVSAAIVLILLGFTFRSFYGVWMPLLVVGLSLVWLLGLMVLTGHDITLLNTLVPTILFVVGMSDVVHLLQKYLEEIRSGKNKRDALRYTIKEIGWATLLTTVTTAIGFMALMTSIIEPVRDFGWITAAGAIIAFVLAIILLPSFLLLFKTPPAKRRKRDLSLFLNRCFIVVMRKRKLLFFATLGVMLLAGYGMSRVEINNYLMEDWSDDEPIKVSYRYFEEHLGGYRDLEFALYTADSTKKLTDADVLQEIVQLEDYLKTHYEATILVSPASLMKGANKALNGGSPEAFVLPDNPNRLKKARKQMQQFIKMSDLRTILNDDHTKARLTAKVADLGAKAYEAKHVDLRKFIQSEIDPSLLRIRETGIAFLIDKNNTYVSSSLSKGLLLAFIAVALLMGIVYRSFAMVIIALIINALPLLLIFGVMGFTGIDLKIATSLVFTIAFGIAVDDTIHFLTRYKLEIQKRTNNVLALRRTYLSTGKAIAITTFILCAGFMSLMQSSVYSTFYIGLLVTLALIFAVLADLIVLPVLITLFYNPSSLKKN